MKSPSCYNELRSWDIFALPGERHLRTMSSILSFGESKVGDEHKAYLKTKSQYIQEHEKCVNLLLDEISVRPQISYASSTIQGMSLNKNLEPAKSVQPFISSIHSKNKDITGLFPVKDLTADELYQLPKKILKVVEECGFSVVSVIAVNIRINRNMFATICGGELMSHITNPNIPPKKIFFLFDSVHILKCIRNNWMNQATEGCTFTFPSFSNSNEIVSLFRPLKRNL